jgi:hypothetical protein
MRAADLGTARAQVRSSSFLGFLRSSPPGTVDLTKAVGFSLDDVELASALPFIPAASGQCRRAVGTPLSHVMHAWHDTRPEARHKGHAAPLSRSVSTGGGSLLRGQIIQLAIVGLAVREAQNHSKARTVISRLELDAM